MRRRYVAIVGAAVLAATGVLGTQASQASQTPARDIVRVFHGTITDFTAVPQRDPAAPQQPGDQAVFVVHLDENGKPVGTSPHHCTAVTADVSLCEAVAHLADGLITFQTVLDPTNGSPRATVAVTGGTGAYRDALGQLTISQNADGSVTWRLPLTNG